MPMTEWLVDLANGLPPVAPTPQWCEQNRVSSGNTVTFLPNGKNYVERWFSEAERIERSVTAGRPGTVLHTAWRLDNIGPQGRFSDRTVFDVLRKIDKCEHGRTYVRLSRHGLHLPALQSRLRYGWRAIRSGGLPNHTASRHEKVTVFDCDGQTSAMTGSIDLSRRRWDSQDHLAWDHQRYVLGAPTHDVGVHVEGPAANHLAEMFPSEFQLRGSGRSVGDTVVQVLRTCPEQNAQGESSIWHAYVNALRKAKSLIYIEDQYFWPYWTLPGQGDEQNLIHHLVDAVRRGVDVVVVIPRRRFLPPIGSAQRNRRDLAVRALLGAQEQADETPRQAGRVLFLNLLQGTQAIMVHSKVLLVDDEYMILGSANVNRRGMFSDYEAAIGIPDVTRVSAWRVALWSFHCGLPASTIATWQARNSDGGEIAPRDAWLLLYRRASSGYSQLAVHRLPNAAVGAIPRVALWDWVVDHRRH
jgi:phosphatidylserine/phosphatidylglycerophosphate/cardiolipin synthase-like enzyme